LPIAELDVVPEVPAAPVEVDPGTPPERFPDGLEGIAFARKKSPTPSRATHPVSVTC